MKENFIFKKIKKGTIAKMIRNKRLRDDISCGFDECKICDRINILSLSLPVLFLDANMIIEQIDAIENFDIINNCIIPQSEYTYLNEKNYEIFNRFKSVIDNRNIYLFPNEFHKDISLEDDERIKKSLKRSLMFSKTVEYFLDHLSFSINNESKFFILTVDINKDNYRKNVRNISILNLGQFAKLEMKESPDLYNYIAHFDLPEDVEMISYYITHLPEQEMKSAIKQGNLFQGKIFFQPGIYDYAIVRAYLFTKDIIINTDKNLNRAMHGDIVCFEILDEKDWIIKPKDIFMDIDENDEYVEEEIIPEHLNIKEKVEKSLKTPTGKIRGIFKKTRNSFCGTIDEKQSHMNFNIFIPVDPKYQNFLIRLYQPEIYYNKRIIINFDSWIESNKNPSGHFIKNLGEVGDIKVENEVILYEHGINSNPFSQKIINSMPREDIELKVGDEELTKRLDLRNICVCSIDPPGCKDIDDALHCRLLDNGNLEVGVHIADVTHYVKAGSEVDKIASKSSNTVYLVHKRTDMLPKVLTENLCSLVGGKERYAFSALWEFDQNSLDIIKVNFAKTVIKSRSAMTYEMASKIMADTKDNSELAISIRNLNRIAKHLKEKRINEGALILASNEMKFDINMETNTINDITMYKTFDTNQLVEEFMLLANVYVADKIYKHYPSCAILRRHPIPKEKELNQLKTLLSERGFMIDTSSSKKLSESLEKVKPQNDSFFNKLVRIMLTRTMNQAKYFQSSEYGYEDFYHYGLAMPIYTHFTSPIRRYADVLVHRLLAAAIDVDYLPNDMSNKIRAAKQCDQMNKQNRRAFFCSRDSNDLSTYMFFKSINEQMEVIIFGIDNNFVKGISIKYGIEADINMDIKSRDLDKKLIYLKNGEILSIFDHILVEINAGLSNYRRQINYNFIKKI